MFQLKSDAMYTCKICNSNSDSVRLYVKHCRIHSNLPKIRFPCCFARCPKTCSSIYGLKTHISRLHSKKASRRHIISDDQQLKCSVPLCLVKSSDETTLVKHLRQHIRDGQRVQCPIKGCLKEYDILSSFSCHLSRDHTQWRCADLKEGIRTNADAALHQEPPLIANQQPVSVDEYDCDDAVYDDVVTDESIALELVGENMNREDIVKNLSLFFARLSTKCLIPDSTIDIIAEELHNVASLCQSYMKNSVVQALNVNGMTSETIDTVISAMTDSDLLKESLGKAGCLSSTKRRTAFMMQHLQFVRPVPLYLGKRGNNKNRFCHYVPVKQSLACLLQDLSVVQQLRDQNERVMETDGVIRDFVDGYVFKQATSDPSKKYLPLILYQDSFEIVNPLGSAKKKHKILGVYYVLGSLNPHNRSTIDNTQLVLLANENDFDCVGQRIFKQLVSDLQELEHTGIVIDGIQYSVVLAAIAGDNLGSHCIGGFVKNFSGTQHFCRYCLMEKSDYDSGHGECVIRTPHSYNCAVAELADSDALVVQGVKFESTFNQLKSFHVCGPGLPPCLAHDLFEGVVAYDLPLFLKYFVKQKWFTIDRLNKRIDHIQLFGSDSRARPAAVHESHPRLAGSASQNWCFLRLLPLLIYDMVNPSDKVYHTLLLLRVVVEHVVSPALSSGQVAYMGILIEDYLHRRRSLFPDVKLRPKHHYLSHYPMLTRNFGPLIRLWTMRFESKHQFFKRCMRNSRNFINVTGMLAKRHQMLQAYLSGAPRFLTNEVLINSNLVVDPSIEVKECLQFSGITDGHLCTECTVRGTVYSKGQVLPIEMHPDKKSILFGKIEMIVIDPELHVNFLVSLKSGQFNFEIGCYVLCSDNCSVHCMPLDSFLDLYPLPLYHVGGETVVVLKHQPVDRG